jgi:hypothetical protein
MKCDEVPTHAAVSTVVSLKGVLKHLHAEVFVDLLLAGEMASRIVSRVV